MVKKLFFILINVIIISLFAALPAYASGSSSSNVPANANFTGSSFRWRSGGPAVAPSQSLGSHYLIIWTGTSSWYTGDTERVYYYSLNDNITSIRLRISDGGCDSIRTIPQNASGGCYERTMGYSYSSTDSYKITADTEIMKNNVDFDPYFPKRVCVLSDLPCYDQNGTEIGSHSPLQDFSMSYFMDGSGVYHYVVGTPSTIAGNISYLPVLLQKDSI